MSEERQLLVRIFFDDGKIETRPVTWVLFTNEDDFFDEGVKFLGEVEEKIKGQSEVFVAFIEKIKYMQFFEGTFEDVHKQGRHPRSDSRSL